MKETLQGRKILVTGAAGFIGYHLCEALLAQGAQVVGLDEINDYYDPTLKLARLRQSGIRTDREGHRHQLLPSDRHEGYRFVQMSLNDREALEELFRSEAFSVVINLAGQAGVRYSFENPVSYVQSNVLGFLHLLECCRQWPVEHLLFASSSSVYGRSGQVPYHEAQSTDQPVSLYAATKKSDELMSYVYSSAFGLPITGLRFFTVYGPWGRPDMSPCLFLKAMLEGKPIRVFNNGRMSRDYTYVDDIVDGIVRLIPHTPNKEVPHSIYNIGNAHPVSLMDFISTLESVAGITAQKQMEPMQPGDVYQTFADITRLHDDVGYQPQTELPQGLRHFYQWYVKWHNGDYAV
ncbi:MAG: NAD-dependent epimerase/dehydratase family protein [Bacteroidaceae bacterium]|nr:NAD-dependent epimerase/dehydratase family protein [Bacteroidaceae bacterium]